jgi:type II secretory pathway pseudopilin PulG
LHRHGAEAGFSLIELMLAMFVFEVGALGLLALIYSSMEGVSSSRDLTHATNLARSKLDELVRLPYDDSALSAGTHDDGTLNLDATGAPVTGSDIGDDDGYYERKWTVATPVSGVGLKSITVRVRWWDKVKKRWRQVELAGGRSQQ